jgi:hypothetical protein
VVLSCLALRRMATHLDGPSRPPTSYLLPSVSALARLLALASRNRDSKPQAVKLHTPPHHKSRARRHLCIPCMQSAIDSTVGPPRCLAIGLALVVDWSRRNQASGHGSLLPVGTPSPLAIAPIAGSPIHRLFGWLLLVARVYEPGRQEPGSRDTINLLVPAESDPRCFKYRTSLTPYLHVGNQTHTSHA